MQTFDERSMAGRMLDALVFLKDKCLKCFLFDGQFLKTGHAGCRGMVGLCFKCQMRTCRGFAQCVIQTIKLVGLCNYCMLPEKFGGLHFHEPGGMRKGCIYTGIIRNFAMRVCTDRMHEVRAIIPWALDRTDPQIIYPYP